MSLSIVGLFILAIASGVMMSTAQKFLSGYSPLLVNAVALAVASCIFTLIYLVGGKSALQASSGHWAMVLLGIAFVGLNYGYSALYGQGVALAYVPLIVTAGMTIVLGFVGYMFFQEAVTRKFVCGALLVLLGMLLMMR